MRKTAQVIALLSLVLLVGSSILYLFGKMPLDRVKTLMLAATVIWFIAAGLWMWHNGVSDRAPSDGE